MYSMLPNNENIWVSFYREGKTREEIAEKFGCTVADLDFLVSSLKRPFDKEEREAINEGKIRQEAKEVVYNWNPEEREPRSEEEVNRLVVAALFGRTFNHYQKGTIRIDPAGFDADSNIHNFYLKVVWDMGTRTSEMPVSLEAIRELLKNNMWDLPPIEDVKKG